MDITPKYKNNRVFVPLRYISEGLKVGVEWLSKVSTVEKVYAYNGEYSGYDNTENGLAYIVYQ